MPAKVDASGFAELSLDLEAQQRRLEDLSPVTKVMADQFSTMVQLDVFKNEQSPFGEEWDKLSQKTLDGRRKGRGNSKTKQGTVKILQDTTTLKRGVFAKSAPKNSILFGVSGAGATYAGTHQFGTPKVPRRPFLPVDESGAPSFHAGPAAKWAKRLQNRVVNWVVSGIKSDREPEG